jgi:hypothetical protein
VKQAGKLVTVIDPKSNNKVTLRSGEYEFELNGKPTGLKLDIERATLKRGKTVVAKITRAPPIIAAAAPRSLRGDVPPSVRSCDRRGVFR